jgi:hypothetical protein
MIRHNLAETIPTKRGRPTGAFYGTDEGTWEYSEEYRLGRRHAWEAVTGLAAHNGWRNLMVEGATEHHAGFREALFEMVEVYPELLDFEIKFDGPWMPVRLLLEDAPFDWSRTTFFHGTSAWAAEKILKDGLKPRSQTNVAPAYGASSTVGPGRAEAIYLTTQLGMAKFAALDAGAHHKTGAVILVMRGLDPDFVQADEDSGESDPKRSLDRIGSVAYAAPIPADRIDLAYSLVDGAWRRS